MKSTSSAGRLSQVDCRWPGWPSVRWLELEAKDRFVGSGAPDSGAVTLAHSSVTGHSSLSALRKCSKGPAQGDRCPAGVAWPGHACMMHTDGPDAATTTQSASMRCKTCHRYAAISMPPRSQIGPVRHALPHCCRCQPVQPVGPLPHRREHPNTGPTSSCPCTVTFTPRLTHTAHSQLRLP